jgi:hypothetical protein
METRFNRHLMTSKLKRRKVTMASILAFRVYLAKEISMIKPVQLVSAVLFLGITSVAIADCEKVSKTVFSCVTGKGKVIEVCDSGKTIDYSFGKSNLKPEIVVRTPRKEASTTQWQGFGKHMSYSVEIPSGAATYSVFWGVDKLMEGDKKDPQIEAGVSVEINKKQAASVMCSNSKPIVQNIEGIDLKPTK